MIGANSLKKKRGKMQVVLFLLMNLVMDSYTDFSSKTSQRPKS